MQWSPASFETWTGHLRMNLADFDLPKVYKKNILCLYSLSLKVDITKTSGSLISVLFSFFIIIRPIFL